ncbi:MAG TPA: polysaccharide deacetylase family protein [Bradyrhizobium sp.]|nr:polysaccharide deacetylase family protein [Bradyrhizobium sp.]
MACSSKIGVRIGTLAALALASFHLPAALAEDCPGHPDAIGTSRTLVVDPTAHPRIGTMQYPETLPLHDHEVVLSFDDGPVPKNSNQVLQILADNCAKATFFTIGEQARAFPDGVRKLAAAGQTIGTHSQTHPLTFDRMPMDKVQKQVDDGIASVTAALPDPSALSPFFRVPGLLRGPNVEQYAASKGLQIWSADFLADDWRHISSAKVYDLAIKRIEAKHKGILLLHDIHARTVAALPKILHELKVRGYHIVQVVAATPDRPATPTEPQDWRERPAPETLPVAERPKFPTFAFAEAEQLVTPEASDFSTPDGKLLLSAEPFEHVKRPLQNNPAALWPNPAPPPANAAATLPAPSETVFAMPEKTHPSVQAEAAQASEKAPPAAEKVAQPRARRVAAGRSFRGRWAQRHAHAVKPEKRPQADSEKTQQAELGKSNAAKTNTAKTTQRRQVKVASLKKREK